MSVLYLKYHDYNMYGVWGLHPYEYQTFAELTYYKDNIWNQQILVLIWFVNNFCVVPYGQLDIKFGYPSKGASKSNVKAISKRTLCATV